MVCRLFELNSQDIDIRLLAKDLPPLQSAGPQKCLAFSTDGSKFATGGMVCIYLSLHILHLDCWTIKDIYSACCIYNYYQIFHYLFVILFVFCMIIILFQGCI